MESILTAIDQQIANLQKVRILLVNASVTGKRRGRPPAALAKIQSIAANASVSARRNKRKMSAEGRARIVAAQKARWAKIRKSTKA
jgi:hypothetical protein